MHVIVKSGRSWTQPSRYKGMLGDGAGLQQANNLSLAELRLWPTAVGANWGSIIVYYSSHRVLRQRTHTRTHRHTHTHTPTHTHTHTVKNCWLQLSEVWLKSQITQWRQSDTADRKKYHLPVLWKHTHTHTHTHTHAHTHAPTYTHTVCNVSHGNLTLHIG